MENPRLRKYIFWKWNPNGLRVSHWLLTFKNLKMWGNTLLEEKSPRKKPWKILGAKGPPLQTREIFPG